MKTVASTFLSLVLEKKKNTAIDKEDDPRDKYARCRKNTRFSLSKRTRVAKLNKHMFLAFSSKQ